MQQEEKKQIGTTDDLSKDMIFEGDEYKNMEANSHSTASEGELNKVDDNAQNGERSDTFKGNEEDSKDNNVGQISTETDNDPTHIPTLEEDESLEKKADDDITS
jgi:hypothetical protein